MNILYVHTHDTGRYIEPYGYAVPSPNLMEFASSGVVFRHAYCAGPTCSPSRAALLTGMWPHVSGMLGLAHRGFALNDYSRHLVQFLNRSGFETVLCGAQHEARSDRVKDLIGYKRVIEGTGSEEIADIDNAIAAAGYLRQATGRPFFLSFGMVNTHRPFPGTRGIVDPNYVIPPFPMYDCDETRKDFARFIESAGIVDRCVGIVLDALHESGFEDDTIVLFTTDHGIAYPRMKCHLYDPGIGVALILRIPRLSQSGAAIDALVSHVDLYPTFCDVLGLEKPEWLQGHSLLPLLSGRESRVRDEVFAEVTYHAAYEPARCIRTERYKLIRFFDDHTSLVPANTDDGASKDFVTRAGYFERARERDMLFDLYLDPVERVNLSGDRSYAEVYADLSRRLANWMKETSDPLYHGRAPKPEGAVVNRVDCFSPETPDFEE